MAWTPPADQVTTDTGWRPPADAVDTHPQDNQRWDQKAADFFQPLSDAADRIQGTMPAAAALMNPALGLAQYAGSQMNQAAGGLAGPVTEMAGRRGIPGPAAAGLGMAASIAANPMSYVDPGAGFAGKVMEPVVPAERAFDIATAQKYKLPMTRADLTGGVGTARVETGLSGTMTGGGAFQDIAQQKLAAIDKAKANIGSRFGTEQPPSASGLEAKLSMQEEMGAAHKTARQLYKDVPDVSIPTSNLQKALDELDFGTVDKSASSLINEIKGRLGKQAPITEETFPTPFSPQEAKGGDITRPSQSQYRVGPTAQSMPSQLEVVQPGSKTGEPHALFSYNDTFGAGGSKRSIYTAFGDPSNPVFQKRGPGGIGGHGTSGTKLDMEALGIPITGREPRSIGKWEPLDQMSQAQSAPTQSIPTYQKLNDIRNLLSKEIQADTTYNPIMGNQVGSKAQTLMPLKKALDADLQDYVKNNQNNPLGKLQSNEFNTAFTKANSFYGGMKNLQNNKFVQRLSRVPESDLPGTVFGTGRVEDINVAKAAMGQKGFNAAKQQFFNDLLNSKNIDTRLAKYSDEFLKGAFNSEELNALKEASSLKKTSFTAEKLAGNPSGTAQRLASMATGAGLYEGLRHLIHDPLNAAVGTAGLLGVPYLASKAYLGSTYGVPYSLGQGSLNAMKMTANASSSARKDLHDEFVRRFVKRSQ